MQEPLRFVLNQSGKRLVGLTSDPRIGQINRFVGFGVVEHRVGIAGLFDCVYDCLQLDFHMLTVRSTF